MSALRRGFALGARQHPPSKPGLGRERELYLYSIMKKNKKETCFAPDSGLRMPS